MLKYEAMKVNQKTATIASALAYGQEQLRKAGLDDPGREAMELLSFSNKIKKEIIIADPGASLKSLKSYMQLIKMRAKRYPLQYLLGTEFFQDLELKVGPGVLIPRPETELILEIIDSQTFIPAPKLMVDLGTGSGNLALSLAKRFTESQVVAVDRSQEALFWARKNRKNYKIKNVKFYHRFIEQGLPRKYSHQADIVVANPPYIPEQDLKKLQPELRYEPKIALSGGKDGLGLIRTMAKAAQGLLKKSGLFLCEIGIDQKEEVISIFETLHFTAIHARNDWQSIPRIIYAKRL